MTYELTIVFIIAIAMLGCKDDAELVASNEVIEINEPGLGDIKAFLNSCPESDPFISEILQDFEIRLNGEVVENISCVAPFTSMDAEQLQMPIILLQSLRVIRHMETGPLPWSDESLYDWMKNSIEGINIIESSTSGGFCCQLFDNKVFIAVRNIDERSRLSKKQWRGISSTIGLLAHEVRHLTGPSHTTCCANGSGCDQVYDLNNISSYGTQLWLNRRWHAKDIEIGLQSFTNQELNELDKWFIDSIERFEIRFCE